METTLDLVLREARGAVRVPLKRAATILGLEAQTLRNQLSQGRCSLTPLRDGRSVFFSAQEIAEKIDAGRQAAPRRGRPSNAERAARRAGAAA